MAKPRGRKGLGLGEWAKGGHERCGDVAHQHTSWIPCMLRPDAKGEHEALARAWPRSVSVQAHK